METQTFSKEEKEEIIRYGLDRIKSICTMTFVTLLMGCIFQVFFQSIIFLVCFIALRKYAGGYHADTQNRCYVISTAIIAVALLAIRYMSDGSDNEIFILLQSLNFTAIRSIAITVGVTNLTVGGCVIVGKIKNFVLNSLQI